MAARRAAVTILTLGNGQSRRAALTHFEETHVHFEETLDLEVVADEEAEPDNSKASAAAAQEGGGAALPPQAGTAIAATDGASETASGNKHG